jgi:MFS family permease
MGPGYGFIAALSMALVASIPMVVMARFFQGLSTAAAIPATLACLSRQCGDDEVKRGRVMSAFEVAAIAGMAAGFVTIGQIWDSWGLATFWPVTALYAISFVVFWSVRVDRDGHTVPASSSHGIQLEFLRSPRALRLVPAWIAVNGVLGVWLSQAALQLKRPDDPTQLLVGGYSGTEISRYGAGALLLFVGGIALWSLLMSRLSALRIMSLSLIGLVALAPALYILNHAEPADRSNSATWVAISAACLVIASGFTPAALAYLARVAEEFSANRGAIMGLYSVLLGVGQFLGTIAGGFAANWWAVDGMILATLVFTVLGAGAVRALYFAERRHDRDLARPF